LPNVGNRGAELLMNSQFTRGVYPPPARLQEFTPPRLPIGSTADDEEKPFLSRQRGTPCRVAASAFSEVGARACGQSYVQPLSQLQKHFNSCNLGAS